MTVNPAQDLTGFSNWFSDCCVWISRISSLSVGTDFHLNLSLSWWGPNYCTKKSSFRDVYRWFVLIALVWAVLCFGPKYIFFILTLYWWWVRISVSYINVFSFSLSHVKYWSEISLRIFPLFFYHYLRTINIWYVRKAEKSPNWSVEHRSMYWWGKRIFLWPPERQTVCCVVCL